jgi:hypothetical protein
MPRRLRHSAGANSVISHREVGPLRHRPHRCHARHALAEAALNASLKRDGAGGAADARAVQSHLDDAISAHRHKFDIAAIRLHGWPNEIEHALHLRVKRAGGREHRGRERRRRL